MRMRFTALLAVVLLPMLAPFGVVRAKTSKQACKRSCGSAIDACLLAAPRAPECDGQTTRPCQREERRILRGCRKPTLRRCRHEGVQACAVPVTTTTTIPRAVCCEPRRMEFTSGVGSIRAGNFPQPLDPGIQVTLDVGPAEGDCRHVAALPAGGFRVPYFCYLNLINIQLSAACAGGGEGVGAVWDSASTTADPDLQTVGDTRDGVCDPGPAEARCSPDAGNNQLGDIDVTRGDGMPNASGVHTQVDIPITLTTWRTAAGTCDPDHHPDEGQDRDIYQASGVLRLTTGSAQSAFVDKNNDGCAYAGQGPRGPLMVSGSPAPGPCCEVGQPMTLVAAGVLFLGPSASTLVLSDVLFTIKLPGTVTACEPWQDGPICEIPPDACAE
jgi:hypothetical protein